FGSDFGEAQRVGIGDAVVPRGVLQPDGIIGRDGVEVGSRNQAMFDEFALVPAGAANPFAGLEGGGFLADQLNRVFDAGDFAERDVVKDGGFIEVAMRVDQAGSYGEAVKIDDYGRFGRELADFFVRTDGGDFAVMDDQGLRDGVF